MKIKWVGSDPIVRGLLRGEINGVIVLKIIFAMRMYRIIRDFLFLYAILCAE